MAPPDNDLRANAQVLDASLGWGIVRGTTVGATRETGDPYYSYFNGTSRSVWYHIPDLKPGTFFFKFQSSSPVDVRFDWVVYKAAPTAVSFTTPRLLAGVGNGTERADHFGGPLTIMVVSYDSPAYFGGLGPFTFGWGSVHDRTASHYRPGPREWAYEQWYRGLPFYDVDPDNPPDPTRPGPVSQTIRPGGMGRTKANGIFGATHGAFPAGTFSTPVIPNDPASDACAYQNARWGQHSFWGGHGQTYEQERSPCPGFLGLDAGISSGQGHYFGIGQSMGHASGSLGGIGVNGHLVRMHCSIDTGYVTLGNPTSEFEGSSLADRPPNVPYDDDIWGFAYDSGWSYAYNELRDLKVFFSCHDRNTAEYNEDVDPTPFQVEVRYLLENDRLPTHNEYPAEQFYNNPVADKWTFTIGLGGVGWQTPTRTDQPLLAVLGTTPDVYYPLALYEPTAYFLRDEKPGYVLPGPIEQGPIAFAPRPSRWDRPSFIEFYLTSTHIRQGHIPTGNVTTRPMLFGQQSWVYAMRDYYIRAFAIEWRPPPYRLYGFPLGCPPFAKAAFKRKAPRLVESYKASMRVKRLKPVKVSPFQGLRCRFGPCNAKRSKVRVGLHEGG